LRVEKLNGKKVLTAKAPHGLLLFSGPVETKEDLDKVPADVRQRYEKLQQRDLPALSSFGNADEENGAIEIDEEPEGEVQSADQV
jgi:hypothetical protein